MATNSETPFDPTRDPRCDVLVLGSLNLDLVVHAPRLPQPGETLMGRHFATDEGGKGANQAVAASRMGARVAMLGCVGRDAHGARLREALQREGIAVGAVGEDPAQPTGVASIVVGADGENTIVVVPGANHGLRPEHVRAQATLLKNARIVVMQLEVPLAAVQEALALARAAGVPTLLNAAPATALSDALLADVHWLVVNETEAATLAGHAVTGHEQALAAAQALLRRGPREVVVTLGALGLLRVSAEGHLHQPAFEAQAVDSTGAGDTFVGTLAAGLAEGLPAVQALQRGQAAAALAVGRRGSQSAMPAREEVLARIGHQEAPRP